MRKTITSILLATTVALSTGCTEKIVEINDFDHDGIKDRLYSQLGEYYIMWGQKSETGLIYVDSRTRDASTAGSIVNVAGHAYENYQLFEFNKRGKPMPYIQSNLNGGKDWGTYTPFERINTEKL